MAINKMNLLQAIGSIVSLILYLFLPVIGVSLLPVGLTGEACMQLSFLFVLPVILLGLTLIVSLLPLSPYNSIAGIATALVLLIIGSIGKSAAASSAVQLLQLTGIDQGISSLGLDPGLTSNVASYAALALKMSWGLTLPILIMLVTAILGLLLSVFLASRAGVNSTNAANGRYQTAGAAGGPARSSRPSPGTGTASYRSRSARYHR